MNNMNKKKKKLLELNGVLDKEYAYRVNEYVRTRYSLSEELSTLRRRDEKPDKFAEYNAFVEECKAKARAEVYGEEGAS